jgi:N,N'-diacetyllegionaminate synthase
MKTYVIAEVGPNHNGSLSMAFKYIDLISNSGANAVKFQLAQPSEVYSLDSFKAKYQKKNDGQRSIVEMSKKIQLSFNDHLKLSKYAKKKGIDYLCSAFDIQSLKFLVQKVGIKYIKIPSGEVFDLNTLNYLSKIKKEIFLSTGMVTIRDLKNIIDILNKNFKKKITILYCVSSYPAMLEKINFDNMLELKKLGYSVGFSDHTISQNASLVAVALGAKVIEKHVTINRKLKGPDHKFSLTINEFKDLVSNIREIEKIIKIKKNKKFNTSSKEIIKVSRKSIVSSRFIHKNTKIVRDDIVFKRPGTGISPLKIKKVLGKVSKMDIKPDKVIKPKMVK